MLPDEKTQPVPAGNQARKPRRRFPWFSLLAFIVLIALGGLGGYGIAIGDRQDAQATQVSRALDEQFALGVQDLEAGRYDVARQRFEFIIENNPNYPGVEEKLAEVLLRQSMSPTPIPSPTPSITPTPDLRGADVIFQTAQERLNARDWTGAMEALDQIRKGNPTYRTVDVDGMYFIALRNRGVENIQQKGLLEAGIYDLTLAERFGQLDGTATSLREGARLYLTGASFWLLDWEQANYYFGLVYNGWPGLWDAASGMTAGQRYRETLIRRGDQMMNENDWCNAQANYDLALTIQPSSEVQQKAEQAALLCSPPTPTLPPVTPTETPTTVP